MKTINNQNSERENRVYNEANEIKVGDKVKVRGHDTPATVTTITKEGWYKVRYAAPVLSFWEQQPMTEGTYTRSAITRNYDPRTGEEIVGNATYYREQLTGDWYDDDEVIEFFGKEIYRPTEKRPSWLVVDDIFSTPRELTLDQAADELAALYAKEHNEDGDIYSRKRTIVNRAREGKPAWRFYKGYEVRVRTAYKNGHNDPLGWSYCVSWYEGEKLVECENGVSLEQAARAMVELPIWVDSRKAA